MLYYTVLDPSKGIFYRPLFSEGQPFVLPYLCFRYSNHRPLWVRWNSVKTWSNQRWKLLLLFFQKWRMSCCFTGTYFFANLIGLFLSFTFAASGPTMHEQKQIINGMQATPEYQSRWPMIYYVNLFISTNLIITSGTNIQAHFSKCSLAGLRS